MPQKKLWKIQSGSQLLVYPKIFIIIFGKKKGPTKENFFCTICVLRSSSVFSDSFWIFSFLKQCFNDIQSCQLILLVLIKIMAKTTENLRIEAVTKIAVFLLSWVKLKRKNFNLQNRLYQLYYISEIYIIYKYLVDSPLLAIADTSCRHGMDQVFVPTCM